MDQDTFDVVTDLYGQLNVGHFSAPTYGAWGD